MTHKIFAFAVLLFVLGNSGAQAQQYQAQAQQPGQQVVPSGQTQQQNPTNSQQRRRVQQKYPQSNQQQPYQQTPQVQQSAQPQRPPVRRVVVKPAPVKVVLPQKPLLSLAPTHILPSAFVLPSGAFIIGTTTATGLFNVMDISTNLYGDLEQVYNVMLKFGILKGRNLALSLWVEYTTQTEQYNGVDPNTGLAGVLTTNFSSLDPGLTLSYRLGRRFTAHTGGNAAVQNPVITKSALSQRTSYIQGNQVHQEFTVGLSDDLALSFGGSYDLTYDVWGAGFSFHIDAIQLGAHYYINVAQGSILPIIGGSFPLNF